MLRISYFARLTATEKNVSNDHSPKTGHQRTAAQEPSANVGLFLQQRRERQLHFL
jgi:hypothetical protein